MKPDLSTAPIGVFDSGVGGLTVLKAIRHLLPGEDLVYLGDTARLPYGTKSPQSIERYASQASRHLADRDIKMLVVACNTASAVALDVLREEFAPMPVIGVVEPGADAATDGRPGGNHLVLATETTVRLKAYRRAILDRDPDARVTEHACELLVALAEEGWMDGDIAASIVSRYLAEAWPSEEPPDSIILGCTHFPLLKPAIEASASQSSAIVDSASTTAAVTARVLDEAGLRGPRSDAGRLTLLATDGAKRFARVGGRFLGEDLDISDVELVDI